jgi:hypothetical protein
MKFNKEETNGDKMMAYIMVAFLSFAVIYVTLALILN